MVKSVSLSWKVLSASSRLRFRDDCMSRAARGLKRELKENTVSAEKRSGGASFAKITSRTSSGMPDRLGEGSVEDIETDGQGERGDVCTRGERVELSQNATTLSRKKTM